MLAGLLHYCRVGDPTWAVRRRMAVVTMLFCMGSVAVCLSGAVNPEIAKTAVSAAFVCLAAIPSAYSLAAVLDDHSKRATGKDGA